LWHSRQPVSGDIYGIRGNRFRVTFVAFAVAGSDNIRYNGHNRETPPADSGPRWVVQAGSATVLAVIRMAA
jgi:hypothetical protein